MVKKDFLLPILFILGLVFLLFTPFILKGQLPIPSDTIVGLYHPYRDLYADSYPNGIPYKNFLITDPVRQTFVWKELAVDVLKSGKLPSWNPYEMAGKPLAANMQSSPYYPLNMIFFILPFQYAWSIFIILQPLLFGLFVYMYARNLYLSKYAALISSAGALFSGFSVSWLEWGNILHTALWLPLLLLLIDKEFDRENKKHRLLFRLIFVSALSCSFLAGHLQIFLYTGLTVVAYCIMHLFVSKRIPGKIKHYILLLAGFLIVTCIQWIPTFQFILASARSSDQSYLRSDGWFLPYRHLIQLIAPDFFGNPATLNYWGTWNYGELTLYIGIIPVILAMYAFYKRNIHVGFFGGLFLVSLLFALPNPISSLPFLINIPIIATAQPTRLIFLATFSLIILAGFGFSYVTNLKKYNFRTFLPLAIGYLTLIALWILTYVKPLPFFGTITNAEISSRNLILPGIIFASGTIIIFLLMRLTNKKIKTGLIILLLLVSSLEMLRFAQKFTPFTAQEYLFPVSSTLSFLKGQKGIFRIASLDPRILPPNFMTHYKLQTIEGYDPLYVKSYARFMTILDSGKEGSGVQAFNRILTTGRYDSPLYDFLNVKYVLSLVPIESPKLKEIHREGQTILYQNTNYFERAFFVKKAIPAKDGNGILAANLRETALVDSCEYTKESNFSVGSAEITYYSENTVTIATDNSGEGYLVFSDAYYPTWGATIDGKNVRIYNTNVAFRGVIVPPGKHIVQFKNSFL